MYGLAQYILVRPNQTEISNANLTDNLQFLTNFTFQVLMTTAPVGEVSFADIIEVTFSDKEIFKQFTVGNI